MSNYCLQHINNHNCNILMKVNPNKGAVHMSDDILNENHQLKTEIIKIRKALKNYEETMVNQFDKIADELGFDKPGFIFQSPEECLEYFIKVINRNVSKNRVLTKEIEDVTKKMKDTHEKYQIYLKAYEGVKIKQKDKDQTILILSNTNKTILSDLQQHKKKADLNDKTLKQEIKNLQQQNIRKENEYKIKYLQQKKATSEKCNHEIGLYRLEMDEEMTKKEKALKIQMDKKDRQVKALVQSINFFIQKNQKQETNVKYKSKERTKSQWKLSQQQKYQGNNDNINNNMEIIGSQRTIENPPNYESQRQIQILRNVIKPFMQHTTLLEKVSDLRKQNIQLKSDTRKINTTIINLQSIITAKNNQINLHLSKIEALQLQLQNTQNQLIETTTQLQKCKNEEEQLDKYYDQRWNSEINRVKWNLQKKYNDRSSKLQNQYTERKKAIEIDLMKIGQQLASIKKQNSKLKKQNQILVQQKQTIEKQLQNTRSLLNELKMRLRQTSQMHEQQILSINIHQTQKYRTLLTKLKTNKNQISKLQNQLDQSNLIQARIVCQLKLQFNQKMKQKNQQTKLYYQDIIEDNQQHINKLSRQIESHKIVIEELQRERQNKIQQTKEKVSRQKDKQFRQFKLKTYEEVSKLKDKLNQSESALTNYKEVIILKQQVFDKEKQQQLGFLNQKQVSIKWLEGQLKKQEEHQQNLQKYCEELQQINKQLQFKEQSQIVQNKSLQFILISKQQKIQQLSNQKRKWKIDIEENRKQFYKGFWQIKNNNQKIISYYKSRIWELEKNYEDGGISKKDFQKIKNLTQQKKKLETEVSIKEAENLVLKQIKQYYEHKSRDLDNKITTQFELKDQKQPIFLRKPKKIITDLRKSKSFIKEDLLGFSGRDSYQIQQLKAGYHISNKSAPKIEKIQQKFKKYQNRVKARVTSSMM